MALALPMPRSMRTVISFARMVLASASSEYAAGAPLAKTRVLLIQSDIFSGDKSSPL